MFAKLVGRQFECSYPNQQEPINSILHSLLEHLKEKEFDREGFSVKQSIDNHCRVLQPSLRLKPNDFVVLQYLLQPTMYQ